VLYRVSSIRKGYVKNRIKSYYSHNTLSGVTSERCPIAHHRGFCHGPYFQVCSGGESHTMGDFVVVLPDPFRGMGARRISREATVGLCPKVWTRDQGITPIRLPLQKQMSYLCYATGIWLRRSCVIVRSQRARGLSSANILRRSGGGSSDADVRTLRRKKLGIFRNLWCVRTGVVGVEPVETFCGQGGGQFFAILYKRH